MNKTVKFIILLAGFIVIMAAAFGAYNLLSEKYEPEAPELPTVSAPSETAEPVSQPETTPEPETKPESEPVYAPDFTVVGLDGTERSLSDALGRPVILNFWATWCGPCKSEMPAIEKLYGEYGEDIEFMLVNLTDGIQDSEEKVRDFIAESGYTFPVYLDTELYAANVYGAYSIPATAFIDEDGMIVYAYMGAMDEEFLRLVIEEVLLKGEQT